MEQNRAVVAGSGGGGLPCKMGDPLGQQDGGLRATPTGNHPPLHSFTTAPRLALRLADCTSDTLRNFVVQPVPKPTKRERSPAVSPPPPAPRPPTFYQELASPHIRGEGAHARVAGVLESPSKRRNVRPKPPSIRNGFFSRNGRKRARRRRNRSLTKAGVSAASGDDAHGGGAVGLHPRRRSRGGARAGAGAGAAGGGAQRHRHERAVRLPTERGGGGGRGETKRTSPFRRANTFGFEFEFEQGGDEVYDLIPRCARLLTIFLAGLRFHTAAC